MVEQEMDMVQVVEVTALTEAMDPLAVVVVMGLQDMVEMVYCVLVLPELLMQVVVEHMVMEDL